jgi:glycosyltransferase involved in cell wall biosynthesis
VKLVHKVSIVVPVYNLESYVLNILNDIKNQTYKDFEVIIVNDGSKDSSLEIVKQFFNTVNSLNSKIISIENSGVSKARNLGLEAAEGEFVLIIDGDDGLKYDAVEKLVQKITKEDADICFTGYEEYTDFNKNPIAKYSDTKSYVNEAVVGTTALKMKLMKEIWICTGNALYRKELLKQYDISYSENMSYGEDIEFIGKCLFHANKVVSVSEDLIKILARPNSALRSGFSLKYLDALKTNRQFYLYTSSHSGNMNEIEKELIETLIDYDYINIFLGIAKKIYDEHNFFGVFSANKQFNKLGITLNDINYKKVITSFNNFKTKELNIFLKSKTIYFYSCKIFNILRR